MEKFTLIEDSCVILLVKGVYKQVDAYRRGDKVYAKQGSGFIRLFPRCITSVPAIRWLDHEGFEAP